MKGGNSASLDRGEACIRPIFNNYYLLFWFIFCKCTIPTFIYVTIWTYIRQCRHLFEYKIIISTSFFFVVRLFFFNPIASLRLDITKYSGWPVAGNQTWSRKTKFYKSAKDVKSVMKNEFFIRFFFFGLHSISLLYDQVLEPNLI